MPSSATVIGYHLVWTAYGHWLPNDPRGSGSSRIFSDAIAELGEIHLGRRRIQPSPKFVEDFYERATGKLLHSILNFDARQIAAIASAFRECIRNCNYTCYGCAVLPDHAHLLIRKHRDRAEEMIENFRRASREVLRRERLVPALHPVWTQGGWKTFLYSTDRVRTVIRYIERNPAKSGLPAQPWDFATPYDNWPFAGRS